MTAQADTQHDATQTNAEAAAVAFVAGLELPAAGASENLLAMLRGAFAAGYLTGHAYGTVETLGIALREIAAP